MLAELSSPTTIKKWEAVTRYISAASVILCVLYYVLTQYKIGRWLYACPASSVGGGMSHISAVVCSPTHERGGLRF